MQVEQALFTSLADGRLQGYHLVARSPGIDERLAAEMTQWGPSHEALIENHPRAESLNFHRAGDEWFVLSRTVYGRPEYSGRGGLQVVTAMLALRLEQWKAYQCHPLWLARTARSRGLLRFVPNAPAMLARAELPDASIYRWVAPRPVTLEEEQLVAQVTDRLERGERIAAAGVSDPERFLERLLSQASPAVRCQWSFTTGLKPSVHRNFRLHFLPWSGQRSQLDQLAAMGIQCIVVNRLTGPIPQAAR